MPRLARSAVVLLALAGCGGTSLSTETTPALGAGVSAAAMAAMQARVADLAPPGSLPTFGSAAYAGFFGAVASYGDEGARVVAPATLTVAFAAQTLTGGVGPLTRLSGDALTGSATLSDGRIEGDGGVSATLAGTLDWEGAAVDLAGTLRGGLLGPGATALDATVSGVLSGPGGMGTLSGGLVAERVQQSP